LNVVEDCACALGAEYNWKKAGNFENTTYFTTEQSKIISARVGGVAVSNDKAIVAGIEDIHANLAHHDN
jgi:dTDP-4-amino-4,6-dideoxygalactose transaminase